MDDKTTVTLAAFKSQFFATLQAKYPQTEIQSFYYILLNHFLGLKRTEIILDPKKLIPKEAEHTLLAALKKLEEYVPIQYIIAFTEFYGLTFKVTPDVLIPRPETEELVKWVLDENKERKNELAVLDIGTGSGCIAVSLAKHLTGAEVYAIDISSLALKIATENGKLNDVEVQFSKKDILSDELSQLPKFDIIVSNPPYVRDSEKEKMSPNVLKYEPKEALYVSDSNPLIFYKKIAELAVDKLKANGAIYFEINEYLGDELITYLKSRNFSNIEMRQDMLGKDRMLKAML